jgi:Protein of unknown function with HXXEE motif
MKTIRRHWYNIGGVLAIASTGILIYTWSDMRVVQRLLFMNFIALLIHQYEEYGVPGGEPAIMNIALQNSDSPDRYPLNQNSAMVINVFAAYVFYLIPVFSPDKIWLGIAPTLFGFGQFVIHGIQTPKKLGQFYNPGLGAVILLHIPIGAFFIYYIISNRLVTILDWVYGVVYLIAFVFICMIKLTYKWLADENSPYIFSDEEMNRFNVLDKINRLNKKA